MPCTGDVRTVDLAVLHWLLPLVAAMSLLTSSVTTWAAAGFFGEAECCCPVKTDCKCHDHDGKPDPTPKMKRCAGSATWAAPVVTPVMVAAEPVIATDVSVTAVSTIATAPIPEDPISEPETPPF